MFLMWKTHVYLCFPELYYRICNNETNKTFPTVPCDKCIVHFYPCHVSQASISDDLSNYIVGYTPIRLYKTVCKSTHSVTRQARHTRSQQLAKQHCALKKSIDALKKSVCCPEEGLGNALQKGYASN